MRNSKPVMDVYDFDDVHEYDPEAGAMVIELDKREQEGPKEELFSGLPF